MRWLAIALWWWADFTITPGVRVGPVNEKSTERSLLALPGAGAEVAQIYMGEGVEEPGVVVYPDDPSRRLEVVWRRSPSVPEVVWICRGSKVPCRWRTAARVSMGTTLKELERLNGKPFQMAGCCFDYGGSVISFNGGKLASYDQALRLFLDVRTDALTREERERGHRRPHCFVQPPGAAEAEPASCGNASGFSREAVITHAA